MSSLHLAQGVLTGKYKPGQQPQQGTRAANSEVNNFMGGNLMSDKTLTAVQQLQSLAQQSDYTLSQLALAWILRQPDVSSAIIGASRPEQIEENVKASEISLSQDILASIDEILADVVSYEKTRGLLIRHDGHDNAVELLKSRIFQGRAPGFYRVHPPAPFMEEGSRPRYPDLFIQPHDRACTHA